MTAIAKVPMIAACLTALAAASFRWGVDSRECIPDDHRR